MAPLLSGNVWFRSWHGGRHCLVGHDIVNLAWFAQTISSPVMGLLVIECRNALKKFRRVSPGDRLGVLSRNLRPMSGRAVDTLSRDRVRQSFTNFSQTKRTGLADKRINPAHIWRQCPSTVRTLQHTNCVAFNGRDNKHLAGWNSPVLT